MACQSIPDIVMSGVLSLEPIAVQLSLRYMQADDPDVICSRITGSICCRFSHRCLSISFTAWFSFWMC